MDDARMGDGPVEELGDAGQVGREAADAAMADAPAPDVARGAARHALAAAVRAACEKVLSGGEGQPDVERQIPVGKGVLTVEAPADWSVNAVRMLATKYMRRAGVPDYVVRVDGAAYPGVPQALLPSAPAPEATFAGETSAEAVFHRLAGGWCFWMCRRMGVDGLSTVDGDVALLLYRAIKAILRRQLGAPNSPQWFNAGLHWAYGIAGEGGSAAVIDPDTQEVVASTSGYEHAQVHACFINSVRDDLVRPGGIIDFAMREARIFKLGSGSGANVSNLRGDDEGLSGGGKSSGMMSFLKVGDSVAGAIKSGGTTRRAAKMIVVDDDHPQVVSYVNFKTREERKVAAIVAGSRSNDKHAKAIYAAIGAGGDAEAEIGAAARAMMPAGLIEQVMARARTGLPPRTETYDLGWESEAYATVAGQNANNSVRVSDRFMRAVERDEAWDLIRRTDRKVSETIRARDLWDLINENAWASGDPGLQFGDTINSWHTCKASGEIVASNPCSEYFFLNDTGCNLASIRLTGIKSDDGYDVSLLSALSVIFTLVLDTSVSLGQYPSTEIAEGTRDFRTLGLGFADLGGMLMAAGIAYDSDLGRTVAAGMMSVITGTAYETSAMLASALAPFPAYRKNAASMRDVIQRHGAAHAGLRRDARSANRAVFRLIDDCERAGDLAWAQCAAAADADGFRNAQVSVVAPTGTIGLVMDCDTTGVEPDFSLKKYKELAGGESMTIVNNAVGKGLRALGYDEAAIVAIELHVAQHNGMDDCAQVREEDRAVFDTASTNGAGTRFIKPFGHVDMMAALQPFISGGISKTVNLPSTATAADMAEVHMRCWKTGVKSVAVYRDGSKLSQPLNAAMIEKAVGSEEIASELVAATKAGDVDGVASLLAAGVIVRADERRGTREKLPSRRKGYTQKSTIDGHRVYIRTGEYPDGRLGEIFLDMHKEGAAFRSLMNNFAIAISLGLQYGVALEEYVDAFSFTRFEPQGIVRDHDGIKMATSVLDLVFRELGSSYLGREDLLNVQPPKEGARVTDIGGDHHDGTLPMPTPEQVALAAEIGREREARALPPVEAPTTASSAEVKWSGIACTNAECGSMHTVRNGTCLLCHACGQTTGCG